MPASKFSDVPLVAVDPAILLCWEQQVNQGKDCSLFLECKKGKISTTLEVSQLRSSIVKASKLTPESQAGIKKKNKNSSKRLQKLLDYHQRLVTEKGFPPSKLLLQHAAALVTESDKKPEQEENTQEFKCDQCDHTSKTMHGLKMHKDGKHKENQLPEILSEDSLDNTLVVTLQMKQFSCEKCVYTFKSKQELDNHMENTHNVNNSTLESKC